MTRSCIGAFLILFTIAGATGEGRRMGPQAPAATNPAFDAELREIAALPGEPRTISAAGVRSDESPVLTLENADAFDTASPKYRAAIFSSGTSAAASEAVLRMVRWFKTSAPPALRERWTISALPAATFDAADGKSMSRWMTFQAPDIAVEIVDHDAHPIGPGDVTTANWVINLPAADDALGATLRAAKMERSAIHALLNARVDRQPLVLARLLAKRYPETPAISYIPSVAWTQTLRLAGIVHDDSLRDNVIAQTRPWITGEKALFGDRVQLTAVAGTMIFADLAASGDAAAGALATKGADLAAEDNPGSIAKYGQGWTDDMFMGTSILARTGARADRPKDFDVAADRLIAYASRLQRADGLFNHASDAPVAWGRGNGFAALGLLEALTRLPATHPARAKLLEIYRRQMAAALAQQAPDGTWREIVDAPGAYREESATAMLMAAMARGVRLGWLDRSYRSAIDRAWRGLAAHVTEDGGIIDICTNTGAGPTRRYYFDRAAVSGGDDRGGAMALLGSLEIYELRLAR
jgi:unsaturated rhamnogalacturonyl hydrolase